MDEAGTIQVLDGGRILAELGPMSLVIQGHIGQVPQIADCIKAAKESFSYLRRIAFFKEELRKPAYILNHQMADPLVRSMRDAVAIVASHELTPMAAVAGTISEYVAHFLASRGLSRVIVNNGGDIAIILTPGNHVRVGVLQGSTAFKHCPVLRLDPTYTSWGIATSGLGGRSLTTGVATSVTVLAKQASIADAAATLVANASFVEHQGVTQVPGITLDPHTDIPDKMVTLCARLPVSKREEAVERALAKAAALLRAGIILGAYVNVQGVEGSAGVWDELIEQ